MAFWQKKEEYLMPSMPAYYDGLNWISYFDTECGMYMSRNREGNRFSIVEWENETAGILTERTDDSGIFD